MTTGAGSPRRYFAGFAIILAREIEAVRNAGKTCASPQRSGLWLRNFGLLADNEIEIVPFDEIQVRAAAFALDRCGEGIDPKARLNLRDCAAYALAET
jgi:uncharacterized protein with PIN domain